MTDSSSGSLVSGHRYRLPRLFYEVVKVLFGGRGGIRTHERTYLHAFQACALSHSATLPSFFKIPFLIG